MKKLVFIIILLTTSYIFAKDYRLSVGRLPLYSVNKNKGILIDILKQMSKEYKDGNFTIEVYPFERSINNVRVDISDFHFPTIGRHIWAKENDKYEKELNKEGLMRSTCSLLKTHFALYTNKNHPIDIHHLYKYRIETDAGHTIFFYKGIRGSTCLECSLKKLEAERIDGFIFASREIDTIIKKDHLKNIIRHRYEIFGSKFILPFNKKGKKLDKIICSTIEKMIKDGSLKRVAKPYSSYFQQVYGSPYIPTLKDINH